MKINKNIIIKAIIYLYITLPFFVFAIGWLKPVFAVIVGTLTLAGLYLSIKCDDFEYLVPKNSKSPKVFGCAVAVIALWVLLSGVGNFSYQNQDFNCRNAIFRALIEYEWPVVSADGTRGLAYYIGFWLPAALVGKFFGIKVASLALLLWTVLGVSIVFYLLCVWRKKYSLWPLLFLILFSGMDYLGIVLLGKEGIGIFATEHIEWWATYFQYSSMSTQLFWVFNQAIPAWIVTMLFVTNQNNKKNLLFIMSCLMLSSTFPFVGLVPFVIYYMIKGFSIKNGSLKEIFSFQNIIGVVSIGIISLLYLSGNLSAMGRFEISSRIIICAIIGVIAMLILVIAGYYFKDKIKKVLYNSNCLLLFISIWFVICIIFANKINSKDAPIVHYIIFYLLEFGIYAIFVYKYSREKIEYYVMILMLILCPFIKVGYSTDFCMRVSIPSLFMLMLFCISSLEKMYKEKRKIIAIVFTTFLIIGTVTSLHEINRSIRNTMTYPENGLSYLIDEVPIEDAILHGDNFSTDSIENVFFKYIAK